MHFKANFYYYIKNETNKIVVEKAEIYLKDFDLIEINNKKRIFEK